MTEEYDFLNNEQNPYYKTRPEEEEYVYHTVDPNTALALPDSYIYDYGPYADYPYQYAHNHHNHVYHQKPIETARKPVRLDPIPTNHFHVQQQPQPTQQQQPEPPTSQIIPYPVPVPVYVYPQMMNPQMMNTPGLQQQVAYPSPMPMQNQVVSSPMIQPQPQQQLSPIYNVHYTANPKPAKPTIIETKYEIVKRKKPKNLIKISN